MSGESRELFSLVHKVELNQPHAPLDSDHDGKHLLCLCVSLPFPLPAFSPSRVCLNTLINVSCMSLIIHWHPSYTQTHIHTSHTHPPCLSVHVCFKGWIQWGLTGIKMDLLSLNQLFFFLPLIKRRVCLIGFPVYLCQAGKKLHMCNFVHVCVSISAAC